MKKIFLITIVLLAAVIGLPCSAEIDPIMKDKPSPIVFECNEDLFIEIPDMASIIYTIGDARAENYFLRLRAEVLYAGEGTWDGLDSSSFQLKYTDTEGNVTYYDLNYMMTAREGLINEWPTMSDPLFLGWLLPLRLVFDVDSMNYKSWSLIFRPAERGGKPVCEIEIPFKVRWN